MWDHCVPTNMASSSGGNTHPVFFNHNSICERFLTKFAKLTIDSPAAMAKLAIDRASIVFGKKIGRFSFQIGRSGDIHYFIKNREISRKIGRLGSSATNMGRYVKIISYLCIIILGFVQFVGSGTRPHGCPHRGLGEARLPPSRSRRPQSTGAGHGCHGDGVVCHDATSDAVL